MAPAARWLLVAACSLALWGCKRLDALTTHGDAGTSAASEGTTARVGHNGTTDLYRMTVDDVRRCPPTRFEAPRKGNIWLGVEVKLQALTSTPVPANAFYARLSDSDGHSYRARFNGCKPPFAHAPLSAGKSARGVVTFEIPEHASGLALRYDPHVPGHPHEEVHFDLGR